MCDNNVNVAVSLDVLDVVPGAQVCCSLVPLTPPAAESLAILSTLEASPQFIEYVTSAPLVLVVSFSKYKLSPSTTYKLLPVNADPPAKFLYNCIVAFGSPVKIVI